MSDNWEFYFTKVNDAPSSIFVDLGLRDELPDLTRPWLWWIWVYFKNAREDGLSSSEEAPALYEIEDALQATVEHRLGGKAAGRITGSGRREFYFYGSKEIGFEEAVSETMKQFPSYSFDSGLQKDELWSQYNDLLYPTPTQLQRIQNRKVVESLQDKGDSLKKPRPVSHWIYFKSEANRSAFIERIIPKRFTVLQQSLSEDRSGDYPFGLTVERVDNVDFSSIDSVTLDLFELAAEMNGDYDGWETSVEKS